MRRTGSRRRVVGAALAAAVLVLVAERLGDPPWVTIVVLLLPPAALVGTGVWLTAERFERLRRAPGKGAGLLEVLPGAHTTRRLLIAGGLTWLAAGLAGLTLG